MRLLYIWPLPDRSGCIATPLIEVRSMRVASARHRWQEEFANSLSHGIAGVAALLACVVLLMEARSSGDRVVAGLAVFLCSAALIYGVSALFHALPQGQAKRILLQLDYCAIYLFIAGSYSAFALIYAVAIDVAGLAIVWGLAAVGIAITVQQWRPMPALIAAYYLATGWSTLMVAAPLMREMPDSAAWWLVIGGIVYTAGACVYLIGDRMRFSHLGWHLFVVAGSGCHLVALMQRCSFDG